MVKEEEMKLYRYEWGFNAERIYGNKIQLKLLQRYRILKKCSEVLILLLKSHKMNLANF
jgi:hypothetical protein